MLQKAMILAAGLLCLAQPAIADTLLVDGIRPADRQIELPRRGLSTAEVIRSFGEPVTRQAPVGNPPISRWDYSSYAVFFEYDRVLHTVVRR